MATTPLGTAAPKSITPQQQLGSLTSAKPNTLTLASDAMGKLGATQPPVGMPAPALPLTGAGGAAATGTAPGPITPWGAGNNLVGAQVNPVDAGDTAASRGQMGTALQSLNSLPDRQTLALDALNLFDEQTDAGYQQRLRGVGQQAAKFGRLGSGMTTSELGDVFVARERDRDHVKRSLANETAGMALSDQLDRLGAIGAVNQQQFGQDTIKRGEVRGERDFQHGVGRDADQHWLQTLQTLLPIAYGGNPSDAYFAAGADARQQSGQTNQALGQLLLEALRGRNTKTGD